MQKNAASQKVTLLAIDVSTNLPKTGDSANITAYVSKDDGAVTILGDTTATELDATNALGLYSFDLTQAETNADKLLFTAKSSTANIRIVPLLVQTVPANFSTLTIANSAVDADLERIQGTAVSTPATAGILDVNTKNINNVAAATPGAAGGLLIAGSNAATTFSGLTTGALACTTITASGAVAFQSTFAVTTSTSLAALSCSTLTASGAVALQSTLTVTGATGLGAVTFNSTLTVSGNTTFSGSITASNASNNINLGTGAITAGVIAADAIGDSEIAADVYTAIWANATRTLTAATNITSTGGTVPITAAGYVQADEVAIGGFTLVSGTADSGTTTTMVDAARTEGDAYWEGASILFTSGTLAGQYRVITDFEASTDRITFTPAVTTAVTTHNYVLLPQGAADLQAISGSQQSMLDLQDFADAGYDPATNKVQGVVLVDTLTTYTGNTVQTGDAFARLGAPAGASVSADILVIDNFVDDLESRLGTPSNLGSGATIAANLVDIENQTDDIGVAGAGLTAIPVISGVMTESYAADGAAPTMVQALYMILQSIMEISISGTTMTIKKLDGTTTAMTVTLNDATNPTSRTRAT